MDYTDINIDEIKSKLKECLTEERFLHSLGTMDMAVELAKKFNQNIDKAAIAGLLHDCAKCYPNEELKALLESKVQDALENEFINPKTWHAPVSAYIAKVNFNITDPEILSSIRWHTLGKINMSDFEKIIFLADKIERNTREEKCRQKIIKTLEKSCSLDKTILKCYKLTIKSLLKRKLPICKQTIDVYNELLQNIKN